MAKAGHSTYKANNIFCIKRLRGRLVSRVTSRDDSFKSERILCEMPLEGVRMGQGLLDKASKTARGPITRLALVRSMISRYRSFGPDKKAGTVGDLIRLLTLEKELLESDQPVKEIKVTWVTPSKTESGT